MDHRDLTTRTASMLSTPTTEEPSARGWLGSIPTSQGPAWDRLAAPVGLPGATRLGRGTADVTGAAPRGYTKGNISEALARSPRGWEALQGAWFLPSPGSAPSPAPASCCAEQAPHLLF